MELPLFPQGSLASSVITTVWIGVFVVAFFNLRLGWTLSGLVVPGYLVPLIIIKPWSALVIVIEGLVTYGLGIWLSALMAWVGHGSGFFGRDRFFLLILVSVAVRLSFDAALLPWVSELLTERIGIIFDYQNSLHSFGLVIVALIANQLWKPGFMRGTVCLIVTVWISYLIVRFVLMEFTNFSLSNLNYLYEDLASDILASPKAYIILLTCAFIASRMNLKYGWNVHEIILTFLPITV